MNFTKLHGLGNDFLILDALRDPSIAQRADSPAFSNLVRRLCDRRTGAGADGVLVLSPARTPDADFRMRIFNADGGEAEMSGNGARCAVRYAVNHGLAAAPADPQTAIRLQTMRSVVRAWLAHESDDRAAAIRLDMGEPVLDLAHIGVLPANLDGGRATPIRNTPAFSGRINNYEAVFVSMGNPHLVVFVTEPLDSIPLETLGPRLERHAAFPNRINVEFARIMGPTLAEARAWERGAGLTSSSGTGACAVLVAGVLTDRLSRHATIHLPGGDLSVSWDPATGRVMLEGPAVEVYDAEWRAAD